MKQLPEGPTMKQKEAEVVVAVGLLRQLRALRMNMARNCCVEMMLEIKDNSFFVNVVGCSLRIHDKTEWAHEDGDDAADAPPRLDYTG